MSKIRTNNLQARSDDGTITIGATNEDGTTNYDHTTRIIGGVDIEGYASKKYVLDKLTPGDQPIEDFVLKEDAGLPGGYARLDESSQVKWADMEETIRANVNDVYLESYQKKDEKGSPDGYVGLDADSNIDIGGNKITTGSIDLTNGGSHINALAGDSGHINYDGELRLKWANQIDIYCNTNLQGNRLRSVADPESSYDAANKRYVDNAIGPESNRIDLVIDTALMDQALIRAKPPGVKFNYQTGSSGLNDMCFQLYQSDSRLRISSKGVDIDWLADGFTHDYEMSNGPYFTIWYMPSIANPNDRPQWKVRKHGRIDRIDWHSNDILCYISSSKSNGTFADGATYYITIGGVI